MNFIIPYALQSCFTLFATAGQTGCFSLTGGIQLLIGDQPDASLSQTAHKLLLRK
jgi:hypothetical protein